ncbi:MAG: hypothetical protein B7X06_03245 [Verrucomicrobia bacterium 21-51-4]|nr:MAG: hypothetical protein B7X06_03245 [Verrucomicrobia bacterium 21-51-4]
MMVDCGFSATETTARLARLEITPADISAILITHEHSDHILGLRGLASEAHLEFFANASTIEAVRRTLGKDLRWRIFETGSTFRIGDLEVSTFATPHDASEPVGLIIQAQVDTQLRCLGWLTDLGHVPVRLADKMRAVQCLVIESNYDEDLLEQDTKRSFSLKQRIRGRHGHLSNEDTHHYLESTADASWEHVFFVHLSPGCNCPTLVQQRAQALHQSGKTFSMEVIKPKGGIQGWFELSSSRKIPQGVQCEWSFN